MTREQQMKIDFAYNMAIYNCPLYSEEDRNIALNVALNIGMQLGIHPMQQEMQQSEAAKAFIDSPSELNGTDYIR